MLSLPMGGTLVRVRKLRWGAPVEIPSPSWAAPWGPTRSDLGSFRACMQRNLLSTDWPRWERGDPWSRCDWVQMSAGLPSLRAMAFIHHEYHLGLPSRHVLRGVG